MGQSFLYALDRVRGLQSRSEHGWQRENSLPAIEPVIQTAPYAEVQRILSCQQLRNSESCNRPTNRSMVSLISGTCSVAIENGASHYIFILLITCYERLVVISKPVNLIYLLNSCLYETYEQILLNYRTAF
jgi:hypothetical protein